MTGARRPGRRAAAVERRINQRRRSEEEVAQLAAVVEGSSDAIVTLSLSGTILSWNPTAEVMYGHAAEQALGRGIDLIVPVQQLAVVQERITAVGRGECAGGFETDLLTRGGTRLPVSLRVSPVRDRRGRVTAVATIGTDLTETRWMAATLDRTVEALQEALGDARAAEQATRRFLADAAHQLRTPVTGIQACAETLQRGTDPADADRLLALMVTETSRAARSISSLLQLVRLDQGGAAGDDGSVDVVATCAAEVDRLRLLAPHLAVRLVVHSGPCAPLPLDGACCQEILGNLGDNALRHAWSTVDVAVDVTAQGAVRVRVADDGPGVATRHREEIFVRFATLDGLGGSGLGLPIARGLARAMGGDVVCSDDGFVLTLPAGPPAGAEAERRSQSLSSLPSTT